MPQIVDDSSYPCFGLTLRPLPPLSMRWSKDTTLRSHHILRSARLAVTLKNILELQYVRGYLELYKGSPGVCL